METLERLKEKVFKTDNRACFIERERILSKLEKEAQSDKSADKYARILARMLEEVSVPVEEEDVFVGRVVEALPEEGMHAPNSLLLSDGHKHLDYEMILRLGMEGILQEIKKRAGELGDEESQEFAGNAEIVINAVRNYGSRYGEAARKVGKVQAAEALERGLNEGAYDLFSALQVIWLLHMIASCYVGERDYAFGRFDQYLYPYYCMSKEAGAEYEELVELLAFFFVKPNEICGRTTWNYQVKPVFCQSSKQYVNLGGETPNELSFAVLDAAERSNMAQPQFTILLKPEADEAFTDKVFRTMSKIVDKIHVYNYDLTVRSLLRSGVPEEVARNFTSSACCSFDLDHHTIRRQYFIPAVELFCSVLRKKQYSGMEELLQDYRKDLETEMQRFLNENETPVSLDVNRRIYVLDAVLLRDCIAQCRYPMQSTMPINVVNFDFPGIATLGDSLSALDKMVFQNGRYSYSEFIQILDENFQGQEELLQELKGMEKLGNDSDVDRYTVCMANIFTDALQALNLKPGWYVVGGFYSLERDNTDAFRIPATPDGRLAGAPYSENQSPSYGADKKGITALLKSLAKLPFDKAVTGGLNLSFSHEVAPEALKALVVSYFELGGLHVGINVLNRRELEDAMEHPENYQNLTVRLYGFSEYFVSLPKWQQVAILDRTEY